jgi:hypothetical protein
MPVPPSNKVETTPELPASVTTSTARRDVKPYSFPDKRTTLADNLDGYDRLQFGLRQFAGADSVDCGRTYPNAKRRAKVDACAIAAFKAGKPFRLNYKTGDRRGIKNWGIAGNSKGQVYFLWNYHEITTLVYVPLQGAGRRNS